MNFEEIKKKEEFKELYDNNEKTFEKYGLLNSEWIEKFKKNNFNENIFKIEDLSPKFENIEFDEDNKKIKINIPNNFVLVSKQFFDSISNIFKNEDERKKLLNLCYEALEFRNVLIIKKKEENMLLFYSPTMKNNIFNIIFILRYSKPLFMSEELKMIQNKGPNKYLKERKITSQKQNIYYNNGEKIGFFYSILQNGRNINRDMKKGKHSKINSIFLCLYQFEDLKLEILKNNDINQNEAIKALSEFLKNFQTQKKESFNKIQSFFKTDIPRNYTRTIISIFEKLNPGKINDNKNILDNQFNQANQYDEAEEKKLFIRNNKTDSIIQNLFYSIKEIIISCPECYLNTYKFAFIRFISIKCEIKNKIQDNIFKTINKDAKEKCYFCSGKETDCNITKKITDFSRILIVILEKTNYDKFNLKENFNIVNENDNIRYSLICFIDQMNDVYFKKDNAWNLYDKNYDEKKIEILDNIYPIVLFYELEKNNSDNYNSFKNKNNFNINIVNNTKINNNYNNISSYNLNRQNSMPNAMSKGIMNNTSPLTNMNGCNLYPNNINQNNMKIFNNVNLMNNYNNIQSYNMNNINNRNNNFNSQQNFMNNMNSNNIFMNNKNIINNSQNNQRSQSSYNNKKSLMNNNLNGVNNNMNNNMIFYMMNNNWNNNVNNNLNNNMNNHININNNNNNRTMNENANNNILNNENNRMNKSVDYKKLNNNAFNYNMINSNMVNMNRTNNNINFNWNSKNNNNNIISNTMNNIKIINNMNVGNQNNPKNNYNNPGNNSNNNINNVYSNNNKEKVNKSNNITNFQNPQSNTLNKNINNLIFLTFTFKKYNKQIFIDVLEDLLFSQVIKELEDKYNWLKKINNKLYYFEGNKLDKSKSIKDLGIKDNSDITIII